MVSVSTCSLSNVMTVQKAAAPIPAVNVAMLGVLWTGMELRKSPLAPTRFPAWCRRTGRRHCSSSRYLPSRRPFSRQLEFSYESRRNDQPSNPWYSMTCLMRV